jgi:hypothetical protein
MQQCQQVCRQQQYVAVNWHVTATTTLTPTAVADNFPLQPTHTNPTNTPEAVKEVHNGH